MFPFILAVPVRAAETPAPPTSPTALVSPAATPDQAAFAQALISTKWWSFEYLPPRTDKKAWTRIRFHADGTLSRWHKDQIFRPADHWQIVGPGMVKTGDTVLQFDETFTTFESRSPDGSVIKKGAREGAPPAPPAQGRAAQTQQTPAPVRSATPTPAPATQSSVEVLSKQGPNVLDWVLSPLDVTVPGACRENLTQLKEALLDDAAKGKSASRVSCNIGAEYCNLLLTYMDQRETLVVQHRANSAVKAGSTLGAHRGDFTTDRRELPFLYDSNWPVYARELREEKNRKKDASAQDKMFDQHANVVWNERVTVLRRNAERLYGQFRAARREDLAGH